MKILSMSLENFQGIKSFSFAPNGDSVSIFGDNGTGKTTVYNAFCYLMYGKPSTAEKNFTPQTMGTHNLNHTAEMVVLTDNGYKISLRKDFHEIYKSKRGGADKVFAGCTTDHYIDGVPVREKDYLSKVAELVKSDEAAKVLTRYNYFLEDMPIKERRMLLLQVCGDISTEDIIASDPKFRQLPEVLGHHSIDDYLKIAAAERKKINDELKDIPSRIDEASRMPGTAGLDENGLLSKRAELEVTIDSVRSQIAGLSATISADVDKQIAEIQAECSKAESEHLKKNLEMNKVANVALMKARHEAEGVKHKIGSLEFEITQLNLRVKSMESDRERLLNEWKEINSQEWSGDTICPTCGQPLPTEKVDEAIANFNVEKSRKREDITRRGTNVSEAKIAEKRQEIEGKSQEILQLRIILDEKESEVSKAESNIKQEMPFDRSEYDSKLADLYAKKADITSGEASAAAELGAKISSAQEEMKEIDSKLAQIRLAHTQKARIEELTGRQDELKVQAETVEYNIKLCEDFNRKKAELLDDKINSRFRTLKFRLFKELNNGGIEDDCEAMIPCDGVLVPFKSANTASRMNAGLEVIDTLSAHYGLSLPIFIDGCESCCHPLDTNAQQIRLYVSEVDKTLRSEVINRE